MEIFALILAALVFGSIALAIVQAWGRSFDKKMLREMDEAERAQCSVRSIFDERPF